MSSNICTASCNDVLFNCLILYLSLHRSNQRIGMHSFKCERSADNRKKQCRFTLVFRFFAINFSNRHSFAALVRSHFVRFAAARAVVYGFLLFVAFAVNNDLANMRKKTVKQQCDKRTVGLRSHPHVEVGLDLVSLPILGQRIDPHAK